jgi:hypothetical protein
MNMRLLPGIAALLLARSAIAADGPDLLKDPFFVSLGTYVIDTGTKVQLDGDTNAGTDVDLEHTFGDDTTNRFRLDAYWRFAERHKLRAFGFSSRVNRTARISDEIDWGDATFPIGSDVSMERKFSIYELAYEYAFLRRDNLELTGSAGLHWTTLSVHLAATLENPDDPDQTFEAGDTARMSVPLPVFGFRGIYTPGHDIWLDATAQYFALSINEYSGSVTDLRLAATWQPKKWLGIGAGYNAFRVDVDVEKDGFNGSARWTYKGPQVFLSASF